MPVLGAGRDGHDKPTDELLQFLQRYADSPSKFQLLFFLARHPNASFDCLILASALWVRLPELKEALSALVDSALVEQTGENGITLYRLGPDPVKRGPVLALAGLTWEQARKLSPVGASRDLAGAPQFCKVAAAVG